MSFWSDIFVKRAEDWIFQSLSSGQVPDRIQPGPVTADSAYLSVTLKSARVVNVRTGLSQFYGTVHSYASVPHRSGQSAEFQVVTTPNNLKDVDAKHIDRVVMVDYKLLGPVPYRGGAVGLETGLFSIRSVDFAAPYISLLETLSKAAGVAFVGHALPFVEPLKTGVNLLLGGNNDSILEIGVATSSWQPRTGYFVAMRASQNTVNVGQLQVQPDNFRLVDSASGLPVGAYPYMVLKVEAPSHRDDWFLIPEISEAYNQLQEDITNRSYPIAKESLAFFKRTVLTSNDLLDRDAKKLASKVEGDFNNVMQAAPQATKQRKELPALSNIPLY